MPTEIICTIIAAVGTALSATISWCISRSTANKELQKLKLAWEREDLVSSDDEFAAMASAVALFVQSNRWESQGDAMKAIAAVRSKEYGEISDSLDALYLAVNKRSPEDADKYLAIVIEQKRESKRKTNTSH